MSFPALLNNQMDVLEATPGRDPTGGAVRAPYRVKAAGVPCKVMQDGSTLGEHWGAPLLEETYTVLADYAEVVNGNVLVIDGMRVRVTGVQKVKGQGTIATYYRIKGTEIRAANQV